MQWQCTMGQSDHQPGWQASLDLHCAPLAGRTRLVEKRQRGPLTVQRAFHPEGAPCHLYLVHPPGGVVGGDGLEIGVSVATDGHALLTTPGATKCYRTAGDVARIHQRLNVESGAVLEWLPQETIFFPGARVEQRTEIALHGDARFFGWELLSLGRPVIEESFKPGWLDSRLRVSRNGRYLLDECLRVGDLAWLTQGCGDSVTANPAEIIGVGSKTAPATKSATKTWSRSVLEAPTGLRGHPVSATLIASGATPDCLQTAREALARRLEAEAIGSVSAPTPLIGLTLLEGGLLIGRGLGTSIETMHRVFSSLWAALRPRLIGPEACPPRIWAT